MRAFGDGTLQPFAESLWTVATPVRFVGTWFPHVMTVVRLTSGEIVLHSPCRMSAELADDIARIGTVAHIVAPNWFHDLYLNDYRARYSTATFWGPALLQRQRPSLIDQRLDEDARPPWFEEMPHVQLTGLLTFDECIFFHKPTQTLIVADFLMNASAQKDAPILTRLGYAFFGLNGNVKVFPILRWFGRANRASLRRAARTILAWNPARLVVGHGTPTSDAVPDRLRSALAYLL
ncbi:MAG TPA: DUF4336 domain-containing protein [Candidatus Baltobacteraceae bacterium]|nr:DUF4336 domain-containing protein [Candidatus Baltobacteraceae bacterium]